MVGLRVAQLDLWHAGRTGGRCTWGGELPAWSSSVRGRQWQHRTQLRRGCPLPLRAKKTHYEALGLEEDATPAEIKRAFRRAARTLHPDVNPSTDAEAQFMAVLEAYQALSDPNARSAYDVRVGTANARANDPRFARFERWRRTIIPLLEVQLEEWDAEVQQIVQGWVASVLAADQAAQEALTAAAAPDAWTGRRRGAAAAPGRAQGGGDASASAQASNGQPATGGSARAPPQQRQQEEAEEEVDLLEGARQSVQQLDSLVSGGPQRMALYVEKRFEQVSVMFPAYPELVWEQEWTEASDRWLNRMDDDMRPWRAKVQARVEELRVLARRGEAAQQPR